MKTHQTLLGALLAIALSMGVAGLGCKKQEAAPRVVEVVEEEDFTLEMIHFDFDKYNIKPEYENTLQRHASYLQQNPTANITVEGNTDEWGTEEYNLALGERRATSAKNYLVNLGVSPDRISTISYGESRPIDPAHNQAAWAMNRNDQFRGSK